jgi:penicillin-binding protein 1A
VSPTPPRWRSPTPPPDLPTGVRRRHRHRRRARYRRKRNVALVLFGGFGTLVVLLVAGGFGGAAAFRSSCTLNSLRPVTIGQNSFVYDANNKLLATIPAERNRQPVPLKAVSPWMRRATVAIEDKRFYRHGGVDYEGIARALWADLRAGRVVEGGSTITQQLVRNLYISKEVTFERKIKEACLAIKLSRAWSKDRILGSYLNQVYYGNHAYGIEAAARTYFNRHARSLTLEQAALLAGLPQKPSVFDPFNRPAEALARRDEVLRAMFQVGYITKRELAEALASRDLNLKRGDLYTRLREPYFFSYVRDELLNEYGANTVRSGGLKVYTTIDPRLQRLARRAIKDTLYYRSDPASAVVSINPVNGAIRAMTAVIPGRRKNQFNLAAQARRQAGSTFKTFVLTTAIARGVNPSSTTYISAPFHYQPDPYTEAWDVATYDHSYAGTISIESATLRSDNTVYAQLTLDLGPENVASMAHRLGIQTPLTTAEGAYVPSMGLGSIAVSPLEMASAYATIAAGGIYSRPTAVRKVLLANGKVDSDAGWGKPERRRVIADWVAQEVTRILEENIRGGTGVAAAIDRTAAGKTGTTENHADAWFCGFTPNLSTTVWIGYPKGEIPMENVHGISVAGGTFPAEIWHRYMQPALASAPDLEFPAARSGPIWRAFSRGQYALKSGPSYYSGSTVPATTQQAQTEPPPQVYVTTEAVPEPKPAPPPPPAPATTVAPPPPLPPPSPPEPEP